MEKAVERCLEIDAQVASRMLRGAIQDTPLSFIGQAVGIALRWRGMSNITCLPTSLGDALINSPEQLMCVVEVYRENYRNNKLPIPDERDLIEGIVGLFSSAHKYIDKKVHTRERLKGVVGDLYRIHYHNTKNDEQFFEGAVSYYLRPQMLRHAHLIDQEADLR